MDVSFSECPEQVGEQTEFDVLYADIAPRMAAAGQFPMSNSEVFVK
jgi:hypothetical protein